MAEQQEETVPRTRNTTEYVVLKLDMANLEERQVGVDRWMEMGDKFEAKSRRDAVAQATAHLGNKAGTFVAVPLREWKPMSRKVETKQVETWE